MKQRWVVPVVGLVLLGMSGCSSSPEPAAEGGVTPVTVGVIPIVDTAPIWLGDEQGFFEDEGIDLTIETTTGGAAAVPGVVSGDFQFAFGNLVSVMVARDQGLELKFIANGTSTTGEEGKDFGAVVVPADSDIQGPADLAGKTVSVNNLANIGDTTIRYVVDQAGGDQSSIKFVEVPFPDAPAALANNQVDAAWILDPFLTTALDEGARVVSWNYVEVDPMLDIAGYFSTEQYIGDNKEVADAFQSAMNKSLEYAQANPEEVRRIVGTYTEMPDEVLARITLPAFRVEFDRDAATKLGEAATDYGTLKKAPDLDALLP